MYYALKEKKRFVFSCAARTLKEHEEKVRQTYWRWRGIQSRGADASIDEFMGGYEQVGVTIKTRDTTLKGSPPEKIGTEYDELLKTNERDAEIAKLQAKLAIAKEALKRISEGDSRGVVASYQWAENVAYDALEKLEE